MARDRVVIAGPWDDPGGMGVFLRSYRELASRWERFQIVDLNTWHAKGGRTTRCWTFGLSLFRLAGLAVRSRNNCIVHLHVSVNGSVARKSILSLLARALGARVVWHFHGGLLDWRNPAPRFFRQLAKREVRSAGIVCCVSTGLADSVQKAFDLVSRPEIVGPCVSETFSEVIRPELGDTHDLLMVGKWEMNKGVDILTRALCEEESLRGVTLSFVGRVVDGDLWLHSKELLGPRLRELGVLDREGVATAMARHRLIVLPSRRESFGLVLAEATLVGRSWVATPTHGAHEIERLVGGGFISRSHAWEDLAAVLVLALDADHQPSELRSRAKEVFSPAMFVHRHQVLWTGYQ